MFAKFRGADGVRLVITAGAARRARSGSASASPAHVPGATVADRTRAAARRRCGPAAAGPAQSTAPAPGRGTGASSRPRRCDASPAARADRPSPPRCIVRQRNAKPPVPDERRRRRRRLVGRDVSARLALDPQLGRHLHDLRAVQREPLPAGCGAARYWATSRSNCPSGSGVSCPPTSSINRASNRRTTPGCWRASQVFSIVA